MATTHKIIHNIPVNSADWKNCELSTQSTKDPLDSMIQSILHHPMKDCISIPWLFSFHYQKNKKTFDVTGARTQACKSVLMALENLY